MQSASEVHVAAPNAAQSLARFSWLEPAHVITRSLLFFLGEDRKRYAIHLPIVLITETGELLQPFLNGVLITMLIRFEPGASIVPLGLLIVTLAASRGIVATVRLRSKRVLGQIALNCRYRARVWGFERLVGFSMSWHQQESAGNKVQRLITGSDAVRDWGNFHNEIAQPMSALLGVVVACAFISPWFILFGAYFLVGMVLIERHYDQKIAQLSTHINSGMESASGAIVEGTTNILTVKASGAGSMVRSAVACKEANAIALGHQRVMLNTRKALSFHVHTGIAFGIFLTAISWAATHHVIAIGFIVTYIQYFNSLRSSSNTFTDRFQIMVERHAELMRLMPLFDPPKTGTVATQPFPQNWRQIRIDDLHYAWGKQPALRGVSLIIQRGERVGITGPSGSGKSSLIKLIVGLYAPNAGSIRIGDVSNQHIAPHELEKHVAVVLQEVELFNVSLRENITLMRDLDDALFARVCSAACLDELIEHLPQGATTNLGERGQTLSGGERQRIGIARALYRQPEILILDEATSALDDETEDHVMQGILAIVPADSVLIAVAHRTRSLRAMSTQIAFKDGALVES